MKVDTCRTTFAVLCVVLFSGCALFSPVKTDTKQYALKDIPLDLPNERTHSSTLLVLVPETETLYATTQMAYSNRDYQVAYFSQNEWVETPSQMIQPLIVETFRQTHYFSEVLPSPDFSPHTFVLRSEILDLKQDFTSEPAMLQLTMRFYLTREATNQVIATEELSVREPMRERNPYAGVVAANEAMTKLLRELARFVVDEAN